MKTEIKNFNVSANISEKINRDPHDFLNCFDGAVGREVAKCHIDTVFKLRKHTFKAGDVGHVSKKLTITINFDDAVIQPHSHFEEEFCSAIVDVLAENVNGLFENSP